MENITLSDPVWISNEQQHVTSELFGATNTDVTKASFTNPVDSPFKSLFPASTQPSSNASSLLFQQKSNTIPPLNPLLQFPLSNSSFPSPLIQPTIPPPSFPSVFTPNIQQSLIQPQLNIGNQQIPTQSVRFPLPNVETTNTLPPMVRSPPSAVTSQDVQHNSQLPQSILPPPPPQQMSSSSTAANPYSARTALSERIYPSMPTTQTPSAHFQQQTMQPQPPPSNHFVPTMPPINTYSGPDTNIHNQSYQPPSNYNPTIPWSNDHSITYDQQQQNDQSLANSSGIWGWLNNNKMLATVVEKAKVCHYS